MKGKWTLVAALAVAAMVRAETPVHRFDFNSNGTIDHLDMDTFVACAAGPAIQREESLACARADVDGDGDVDQADFGILQSCYSGMAPADLKCANFHAPVCTLNPDPETLEDTPFIIQLTASDADLPWDQLTFTVVIAPNLGGRFYQVAAEGTPRTDLPPMKNHEVVTNPEGKVWFVPPSNWYTSPLSADVAFGYSVTDASGATSFQDAFVKVLPVNDPPVLQEESFALANTQVWGAIRLHPYDVEVAANEQNVSTCFTALPRHGTLYVDDATPITQVPACFPTLTYRYVWNDYLSPDCGPDRPAAAFPLTDSFNGYVNDGLVDSDTVTDVVEIRYYNTSPVLTGPASVETTEETPVPVLITATDIDNDDIVVMIAEPLPARGTLYYYDEDALATLAVALGQRFAGVPVALTYVPLPDANTADGVADVIHVRLQDVRLSNPFLPRDCDYGIPVHIAPLNDVPVVTSNTHTIIANVSESGAISPAFIQLLQVADDAQPGELLAVTLVAAGPEADHLALADGAGLVNVQQVSPLEIQFEGTLVAINAAFAKGVYWYPNGSQTGEGTLTVLVNDLGHSGSENPPVPRTGTLTINVEVSYEGSIPL